MDSIEIFPHISLWKTTLALAILDIMTWLRRFGIHRYVVLGRDIQWIDRHSNDMYNPKHVYQGKHSPGNAGYKPRHSRKG